jgi:hypothetical protein
MDKMRGVWQWTLALIVRKTRKTIGPLHGIRMNSALIVFPLTIVIILVMRVVHGRHPFPACRGGWSSAG